MSDADLEEAMKDAGQPEDVTQAALDANAKAGSTGWTRRSPSSP